MEEYGLMKQAKYRTYMSNVDKALKNFEYSSEWPDLISALGKLNKVISSCPQYQIIPRRIKISKRLAQCMHPALPSGVHLKALETYDIIFSNTGVERLASELFIYSAGLFPLLGYAAMNVRPALLGTYEKYFVPLGERLRPALSGFLSGVLPGYESGLDHFERTNSLLGQVCTAVSPIYFYTCLWECVATNASVRLPAVSYLIDHFNKRLGMDGQKFVMGNNFEIMMVGLCACLNDAVILVQRNTLEFLLLGFPLHTSLFSNADLIKLVTNGLNTILRRDMSLNRRLYAWLLGTEVTNKKSESYGSQLNLDDNETYFSKYSKLVLIKALRTTLKISLQSSPVDLSPYRILVSLLDKVEIGPVVLDDVLCDVIRTMSLSSGNIEVCKSGNLLFATFDPAYIWNYMTQLYETSCKLSIETEPQEKSRLTLNLNGNLNSLTIKFQPEVDSGPPNLVEVCYLTEFLLETISLEMYTETTRIYLPKVFLAITQMLTVYSKHISHEDISASLKLCMKIVSRVQPMVSYPSREKISYKSDNKNLPLDGGVLEKSKSDSRLNQSSLDDEMMKRSNSNHSMNSGKKSPGKTKKKSKSYSKLLELDKEIESDAATQLSFTSSTAAISTPNLDYENTTSKSKFTRGKKSPKPKKSKLYDAKTADDAIDTGDTTSIDTDVSAPTPEPPMTKSKIPIHETTMQEYSILEKCIKQYEIFYQVFVSQQIFQLHNKPSPVCSVRVNLITDGTTTVTDANAISNPSTSFITDNIIEDTDLGRIADIDKLFDTLKVNVNCRQSRLYELLNKTISGDGNILTTNDDAKAAATKDVPYAEECVFRLMELRLNDRLREAVKLASNLLVEMSTFPNYNQELSIDYTECDLPCWLKVLCLIACYLKSDKELQISATSTLFELVSLLKSQISTQPIPEHSTHSGVMFVVMLPLLKFGHLKYLENKTRLFQVLTSTLWDYLGEKIPNLQQISSLLYQLNNCLDNGLVEEVIGHRISSTHHEWQTTSDKAGTSIERTKKNYVILDEYERSIQANRLPDYTSERLYDVKIMCQPPANTVRDCNDFLIETQFSGFKKFELLWHLGRESHNSKGFEKTLLKMLDKLALPHHSSIRIFVTKWLQESFIRGDLSRIIRPLLKIMLAPNTKKISIVHAHSLRKANSISAENQSDKGMEDDDEVIMSKDVYAVRNEDGNVSYHIETPPFKKRSSPIRSLHKKFFGAAIGTKYKMSNVLHDRSITSDSHSMNSMTNNMSLIINPLENSMDMERERSLSSSAPSQTVTDHDDSKLMSFKEDFYSSADDDMSLDSSNETDSVKSDKDMGGVSPNPLPVDDVKRFVGNTNEVAEILSEHDRTKNNKKYRLTKTSDGDDQSEEQTSLEDSTPAEEYFTSATATEIILENIVNDLIMESIDKLDDEENHRPPPSATSNSARHRAKNHHKIDKKSRHSTGNITENSKIAADSKRLSCASKTSSSSNNSNYSDSKEENSENEIDTNVEKLPLLEPENNNIDVSKLVRNLEKTTNDTNLNKLTDKSEQQKKINWEKTKEAMEKVKKNVEILRENSERELSEEKHEKIHPFHSNMLLYFGVYDTKQVLYAFQTLRNIIACDCRTFLCLSVTSAVSNSQIKHLLIRHKKSISGKGFSGTIINTEFSHALRGCMYFEALVTICLSYARSYFQREAYEATDLPSTDDIHGNHKIQMASIELLTLLCTELILIVKETGKTLACYIADLMTKCKLQKIILHCILLSVHSLNKLTGSISFSEQILRFNDPGSEQCYIESCQVQLLRLLKAVIKLEYEVTMQKSDETTKSFNIIETNPSSHSPTRASPATPVNVKYLPNCLISQQPMFLSAILSALQSDNFKHLHRNWTDLVTSSLGCLNFGSLTNIVISVVHQICGNIDKTTRKGKLGVNPPDYAVSQLEALTVLCHYCLLDNTQQNSVPHIFSQAACQQNTVASSMSNSGQILNSLVHVFLSNPISSEVQNKNTQHMAARNAVLSHLPRIVASVAALWENEIGQAQNVKHQLLEFLSPISLHHGVNFLTAISVAWQERGENNRKSGGSERKNSIPPPTQSHKALPQACPEQMILVRLVSGIRVMPMDSFVQTLHHVIKSPPPIHHPPAGLTLEVSALELFYFYMKGAPAPQLSDSWASLLALLRDGLSLSASAQFVMLAILNEFVQRCPQMPFQDKKDLRDLHDITSRLVEALSTIAGACLEQTTWLRRNLAVKEDVPHTDGTIREGANFNGNQQYSVQAQSVLAVVLANLLDVAYGSQEKDKVIAIVTTLMYNIIPYLKNHTQRNIPSYYACSHLLSSLSGYQYTRKAWRKDLMDLVLDATFFQMDHSCLPFWKSILDSLMTYDNTTFRELMNRVSLAQTGSLNIFTSKEQEYEQRALLLKRLAFVIFCSELDQYHKYMPEIQEQLVNSLRLPQVVPSVQAAVFLCFRVLLLRMSPDHVTSLWPIIIAEMVQVFLAIEQELMQDTEECRRTQSSQHIKMLSGLETSWMSSSNNGFQSHGHPHWRMVQLETSKLLELGCVLPATVLPHFQMYRWAFVGGKYDGSENEVNGHVETPDIANKAPAAVTSSTTSTTTAADTTPLIFVPHVNRIARLMDFRYRNHSPQQSKTNVLIAEDVLNEVRSNHHLELTCQTIANLQDLHSFFSTLGVSWAKHSGDNEKDLANCLAEIEQLLAADFLEKMPSNVSAR